MPDLEIDSATALAPQSTHAIATELAELASQAADFAKHAKAPATRLAYRKAWQPFERWCAARGLAALPASSGTLALYISHLAVCGRRPAGIALVMAAISQAHVLHGHPSPRHAPEVRTVWQGMRRKLGMAPKQKHPILVDDLQRLLATFQPTDSLVAIRNRAMILTAFAGAFRRSEVTALRVDDLVKTLDGYVVDLRRSKTDQEGHGRAVGLPHGSPETCPVRAIDDWLRVSGITSGPLFIGVTRHGTLRRSKHLDGRVMARLVKQACTDAGLPHEPYAGHSLRAGFVTSAALADKDVMEIMAKTGHKSANMVMKYIRKTNVLKKDAAKGIV